MQGISSTTSPTCSCSLGSDPKWNRACQAEEPRRQVIYIKNRRENRFKPKVFMLEGMERDGHRIGTD